MKEIVRRVKVWVRPQLVACLVVVCLLVAGFLPPTEQESHAASTHKPLAALSPQRTVTPQTDCTKVACFALTFDDGPDTALTPQVLDILAKHRARATFFVLGAHVNGKEQILRRTHEAGHEIGNHSWSHAWFTRISLEQVEAEITNTQTAIMQAGVPAPRLFRPPYGDMNDAVRAHVPLTIVRWNIDPEDWHPKKQKRLVDNVAAAARPGGMAVLHDTEPTTVAQLEEVIAYLQGRGFALVTVSELLSLPAGQPGVFFGRQ